MGEIKLKKESLQLYFNISGMTCANCALEIPQHHGKPMILVE